jgi:hypothetical protein
MGGAATTINMGSSTIGGSGSNVFVGNAIGTSSGNLTVRAFGTYNSVNSLNSSGGYPAGTYANITVTGGSGTGMIVSMNGSASGYLNSATVTNPGTGYQNGDAMTIPAGNPVGGLGGTFTLGNYNPNYTGQGLANWNFSIDGNLTLPGNLIVPTNTNIRGNLIVGGNITQQSAYYETYGNISNSGGNLTCNFNLGSTFYAVLGANVTANFTNVNAISGTATGATIIIDQGATAYRIANVQVNGVNQTIRWVGAAAGVGTANNTDVMSFSLISLDGTNWRVLGQISNYG